MSKIILAVLIIAVLAAGYGIYHMQRLKAQNDSEMSKYRSGDISFEKDLGRVLVVYYSKSGKTKKLAEKIKEKTNADIFEIEPEPQYSSNYLKFIMSLIIQNRTGKYPKLKGKIPDFEQYDLIFAGSPVWNYTVAPPLISFLKESEFKAKTVVPFASYGGNAGDFFKDFKKNAKNAYVLDGFVFFKTLKESDKAVDNKVSDILNRLDFQKPQ
ncbi:MAG: hypothetical protein LBQ47_01870 [Endomicrobium sp.]|nr:hypothetical protein [Endomicrobium sp.]